MHIPILVAIIVALVVVVIILRKQFTVQTTRLEHDLKNKEWQPPQEREPKRVEQRPPAVEAEVPPTVEVGAEAEEPRQIPEDSALRRHFLTQLRADVESELPPRPTDATLRRHHEQMVVVEMETRVDGPLPEAPEPEAMPTAPAAPLRVVQPPVKQEVKAREAVTAKPAEAGSLQVPEDSTLRRHFLTQMRVEIEAGMPPAPTDFSLRRHYDATVDAELEKRLAGGNG